MSLLLAWHHGLNCGIDVAELLKLEYSGGTADRFLMLPGTAFRSTQGSVVEAWAPQNLEDWEIALLGKVRFIGDGRPSCLTTWYHLSDENAKEDIAGMGCL